MARSKDNGIEGAVLDATPVLTIDSPEIAGQSINSSDGIPSARAWSEVDRAALQIEHDRPENITGIFSMAEKAPEWWVGNRCECPVLFGQDAVRLHTGEIIPL